MVLLLIALQRVKNTMKNTIDDANHIIYWIVFIINNQYLTNSFHSHSIINKPVLFFKFMQLFLALSLIP